MIVESYSFFLSREIYNWYSVHGKLSPLHSLTIMNANEKFVQYLEKADTFIKDLVKKKGINVEYNQKLTELDPETQIATFVNTKTGEVTKRDYSNVYQLMPCKI